VETEQTAWWKEFALDTIFLEYVYPIVDLTVWQLRSEWFF
jgi:hypothetical protein